MKKDKTMTRRDWLASVLAGGGLMVSYGVLAAEGVLFLLPPLGKPKTRKIFAGRINQYQIGGIRKSYDLRGNQILVRRNTSGFSAFSSTCPHLGCKVHWEEDKNRFLCPCHMGIFDADGKGISGPPGDAGQSLIPVPVEVDQASGVVYLEVEDIKSKKKS